MSTLDDKILGEKLEYYCSSDEENGESDEEYFSGEDQPKDVAQNAPPPTFDKNGTSNTGPKGVIKDWQRFKQLEAEKREEQEKERIALAQRLSLTCRTAQEDQLEEDPELADLLADPFILEYAQRRMQEMFAKSALKEKFGVVQHLMRGEDYLDAIDKEDKEVTIILHIFEENNTCCKLMNDVLEELCLMYRTVKFCKMSASSAGLSRNFKVDGVPALLVYKTGQLIGNFVRLSEEFGTEFTANDVENFLIEKGVILANCQPNSGPA